MSIMHMITANLLAGAQIKTMYGSKPYTHPAWLPLRDSVPHLLYVLYKGKENKYLSTSEATRVVDVMPSTYPNSKDPKPPSIRS